MAKEGAGLRQVKDVIDYSFHFQTLSAQKRARTHTQIEEKILADTKECLYVYCTSPVRCKSEEMTHKCTRMLLRDRESVVQRKKNDREEERRERERAR